LALDENKLKAFLNENNNLEKFNYNIELINFHKLSDDDISTINYFPKQKQNNFIELRKLFQELRFYSLTNDTSWNKFLKTFEKYFN
jgi:hypothetical protein